jgi:DNA polymerase-3 subunit delta
MKLSGRDVLRHFQKPDARLAGTLIYGNDAMRVALRRQELLKALLGDGAEEEMRLTQMAGGDLRRDAASLNDAIKERGFFGGQRAVFVSDATDTTADAVGAALQDWQPGDAALVVTAGSLNARSNLRGVFEKHPNAVAIAVYDDPPSREEIEIILSRSGLGPVDGDAMRDLTALAQSLDPGDFAQTIEKLALYKLGDTAPLGSADIIACAPATVEADVDDALHLVAEARLAEIAPVMNRLGGQGVAPVTICINAARHFRALHFAAAHPKGPDAGIAAVRPPIYGKRRDRMARQARALGVHKTETALAILVDTDLALRSSRPVPARAMLERALIRIAMLART